LDYETFNCWLEGKVWHYYKHHVNASRDQLAIFMSPKDYSKFLRMLQENLPAYLLFHLSIDCDVYKQCKYRGVVIKPCESIKDNEYKMYVEL